MAQLKKLLFCRVFANVSGVYPKITINQSISQRLCSTTTTIDLDNNETFLKMRPAAENKMVRESEFLIFIPIHSFFHRLFIIILFYFHCYYCVKLIIFSIAERGWTPFAHDKLMSIDSMQYEI